MKHTLLTVAAFFCAGALASQVLTSEPLPIAAYFHTLDGWVPPLTSSTQALHQEPAEQRAMYCKVAGSNPAKWAPCDFSILVPVGTTPSGSGDTCPAPGALWHDDLYVYLCNAAGTSIRRVGTFTF